jgi:very-short-patch-repair endonuclease
MADIKDKQLVETLFKTINALCATEDIISDFTKYSKYQFIDTIRNLDKKSEFIHFYSDETNEKILSIKKPKFEPCPVPVKELVPWLQSGWTKYKEKVTIYENLDDKKENFLDSPKRVTIYNDWLIKRNEWVQRQLYLEKIENLFTSFNHVYDLFRLDSEQYELLFAFGMFKDLSNSNIRHPLFTKRIRIDYNDIKNNIITIFDTDNDVHFDSSFLNKIHDNSIHNFDKVNALLLDYYSIFDAHQMKELLQKTIHLLSTRGEYYESSATICGNNRFIVTYEPLLILRTKASGMMKFTEKIIDNIDNGGEIPPHLIALLHPKNVQLENNNEEVNESIDRRLAAVSGEDSEIYMTKPANREQLRIAREIEKHAAVEVQGPPGTGKTHTIANLIGHFLAQGKTLLVTSEKTKALTVLRDKLDVAIKPLCLPVFDDNQTEMQYSVNEILSKQGETSVGELKRKIDFCQRERKEIITKLNNERKAVFQIRNKEAQNIIFDHKGYSVIETAQFVSENRKLLPFISGTVKPMDELPLSIERFQFIYRTNADISLDEEKELARGLPDYKEFMLPDKFKQLLATISAYNSKEANITNKYEGSFETTQEGKIIYNGEILFGNPDLALLNKLIGLLNKMPVFSSWQLQIIADCFIGSGYEQRWNTLIEKIDEYCQLDKCLVGHIIGNCVEITPEANLSKLKNSLPNVIEKLHGGTITSFYRWFHNDTDYTLKNINFNEREISNAKEASIALEKVECKCLLNELQRIWNDLFDGNEVPCFSDIHGNKAVYMTNIANKIKDALHWRSQVYEPVKKILTAVEFNMDLLGSEDDFISAIKKKLEFLMNNVKEYVEVALIYNAKKQIQQEINKAQEILHTEVLYDSVLCQNVFNALGQQDAEAYTIAYTQYKGVFEKFPLYTKRVEFFDDLRPYASNWAEAIRAREGIQNVVDFPCDLVKAWKVKQLNSKLVDLFSQSIDKRQENILAYGRDLRKKTSEVASLMAWKHLLQRLDGQQAISSALNSWSSLIKKIGKGKGKMVSVYRKSARLNMLTGQSAVPAWIIPVKKILETFDPVRNHFDIAIIDEASQSSLEALAITYMANKIIVVGDDKQVSPMLIGKDIEPRKAILEKNLASYIDNWPLFDGRTSFYELVGTVFQPLMLREHFRCMPEIIGYSNEKFYNNQILPLRDSNQCQIYPPVINFRVDGKREGAQKLNYTEANAIVSLIQACCEQKEYEGKTFGVISMLGDEQAEYINALISKHITDYSIIKERDLICGNSASFQGDERDIMFLSMVDDTSTVRKTSREDDAKRYNVAASRAKDQLWVVNSIDYSLLQQDDLHYGLLEYSNNYKTHMQNINRVKEQAESVFEEEVAKYLLAHGYHISQQYAVGAYRLDIVVHYKNKLIAIECDGQRYHSGEEKICQDMERQCILERLGYRFIRIGGGQFYRDKDETMELVFCQLKEAGIYPETQREYDEKKDDGLLQQIVRRASEIRLTWQNNDDVEDIAGFSAIKLDEENHENEKDPVEKERGACIVAESQNVTTSQNIQSQNRKPSIQAEIDELCSGKELAITSAISNKNNRENHVLKMGTMTTAQEDSHVVAMGDTISIKSLDRNIEKKYRMMTNTAGHKTELANVCIGHHKNEIINYQDEKYIITEINQK